MSAFLTLNKVFLVRELLSRMIMKIYCPFCDKEHEISIITGNQAINAVNTEKYEIVPIYIAKNGVMYTGDDLLDLYSFRDMEVLFNDIKLNCKCCNTYFVLESKDDSLHF